MSLGKDLGIVIPSYHNETTLGPVIESVLSETQEEAEVIVVNSSEGFDRESLAKKFPSVQFNQTEKRLFAGTARNDGAKKTSRPILVFLDADCRMNPGWLKALIAGTQQFPNWQAFNGQVLYESPSENLDFSLHLMEFHEFLAGIPWHPRFLHSGNLVIRRAAFENSKGFREDIPMCTDFTYYQSRTAEEIQQTYFLPNLSVTHLKTKADKEAIHTKVFNMGYWRGYVDLSMPLRLQISAKRLAPFLLRHRQILGFAFFFTFMWRSLRLMNVYSSYYFKNFRSLYSLSLEWARGFLSGIHANQRPQGPS